MKNLFNKLAEKWSIPRKSFYANSLNEKRNLKRLANHGEMTANLIVVGSVMAGLPFAIGAILLIPAMYLGAYLVTKGYKSELKEKNAVPPQKQP
jgi:hypothetical protein